MIAPCEAVIKHEADSAVHVGYEGAGSRRGPHRDRVGEHDVRPVPNIEIVRQGPMDDCLVHEAHGSDPRNVVALPPAFRLVEA